MKTMILSILSSAIILFSSCSKTALPLPKPLPGQTQVSGQNVNTGVPYGFTFSVKIAGDKSTRPGNSGASIGATILNVNGYNIPDALYFLQDAGNAALKSVQADYDQMYQLGYIGYTFTWTGSCQAANGQWLAKTVNPLIF